MCEGIRYLILAAFSYIHDYFYNCVLFCNISNVKSFVKVIDFC